MTCLNLVIRNNAWKVSKYRVFSGPYFPAFELNTERCGVFRYVYVSEYERYVFSPHAGNCGPEKNSVFGHFSRSVSVFRTLNLCRLKPFNYFRKTLHLRYLKWFWMRHQAFLASFNKQEKLARRLNHNKNHCFSDAIVCRRSGTLSPH